MLGWCHEFGIGVEANWEAAKHCYRQAGDGGSPGGLGACHEYGLGVPADLAKAREQYKISAANGGIAARNALARLNAQAPSEPPIVAVARPSPEQPLYR